jgi:putative molybdopterin biosynthesis protein
MKQDQGLNNHLRQLRLKLGMSQQDLANIAKVSRQTIGGVESGQYAPSVTIALRLSKALGCRLEDLFSLQAMRSPLKQPQLNRFPLDAIQSAWRE